MNLSEKIRKIEHLIALSTSEGERQSALLAKQRLESKFQDEPIEYTIYLESKWQKNLFVAICKKYRLDTYRYTRQKYTTTMVRVGKALLERLIWPEFTKYDQMFGELANDIMVSLISKIHNVTEEETVISGALPKKMA